MVKLRRLFKEKNNSSSTFHHQPQFPALLPWCPHSHPHNLGDDQGGTGFGYTWGFHSFPPLTTTMINIHSETVVPNHTVWSLFNTIFMNLCCLGFVAFTYSVNSRAQKMVGDVTVAQDYASTTNCLNIWALFLGLLLIIIFIIIYTSGSLMIFQAISDIIKYYGGC